MTLDIENWLDKVVRRLRDVWCNRLLFVGLQGSYNRGEATAESDIDLVVILDKLDFVDLKIYREIIEAMPYKEKVCGFISGKEEIQKWSGADLFQFYYDTRYLFGKLDDIIQPPSKNDIKMSVKISAENLYHSAVHSFMHSDNRAEDLRNLYKMTFFILQAKYFVEKNTYIPTKRELLKYLQEPDREILDICINRKEIVIENNNLLENLYQKLIAWSAENI